MKTATLSPKQKRFCQEYIVDLNGAQAAIRAGYSPNGAPVQAVRLLTNANVSKRISELRDKQAQRTEITADRVLREFAKLAFLDIRKAFTAEGDLVNVKALDDDTAAAVAGLEFEEVFEMQGEGKDRERVHTGRIHKIKLSDKVRALEGLAKHLGMFVEKVEMKHQFSQAAIDMTEAFSFEELQEMDRRLKEAQARKQLLALAVPTE